MGVHVATDPRRPCPHGALRPAEPRTLPAEKGRLEEMRRLDRGRGYLQIQTTRPQTLAYGLTDSPVGQLAWIVEKFKEWTDLAAELPRTPSTATSC